MANPLINHFGLPLFDKIKTEHIEPAVKQTLDDLYKKLERIEKEPATRWTTLMEPLEDISLGIHHLWSPISHLNSVANTPELREAYQATQKDIIDFGLRLGQSQPIYKKLTELKNSSSWSSLDSGQKRSIEGRLLSAKLSGIDLPQKEKERFNQLSKEISELETNFSNNLLDATRDFELIVTNTASMQGVPNFFKAQTSAAYLQKYKDKTSDPQKGPWLITLDYPSFGPFMEHCSDDLLREKIYKANITKASGEKFSNEENILKILSKRKELAQLLGFKNYADLSLATKMATSVEAVYELENELITAAKPFAEKELEELQHFAEMKKNKNALKHWDIAFWSTRLEEERFGYTDEQIRPYFALPNVLSGLFDLVRKIFAIRVEAADGQTSVWHKDVRFFRIFDERQNSKHIASFYLDPYSRPGSKNSGAWMNDCISRYKRNNQVTLPVAYLVCNFSSPQGDNPSLLTFGEVETLFHEFGHGLQHMLTTIDHLDVSGINQVEWDAVELPSQFMENWCYHKPTIMSFAKHYQTGVSLDEGLFQKISEAKTFQSALQTLRQVMLGLVDMHLYHEEPPKNAGELFAKHQKIAKEILVIPPLPEDRFLCSFSHIFAGSYSAGYYSYKWAEVLSADAFGAFEDAGLDKEAATKDTGIKFRDSILALGGSRHPMDIFVSFRGRKPNSQALLRHLGLKSVAK